MTEIREPTLAMTFDETQQMLDLAGVSLAEQHARRLWDRTEGWVGALRLAMLSLRDHLERPLRRRVRRRRPRDQRLPDL